jgi:hypothetical protein
MSPLGVHSAKKKTAASVVSQKGNKKIKSKKIKKCPEEKQQKVRCEKKKKLDRGD